MKWLVVAWTGILALAPIAAGLSGGSLAPSDLERGFAASSPDPPSRLQGESGIGPGSKLAIRRTPNGSGLGCTANFIFEAPNGTRYIGTAGHCVVPDDRRATHGPAADFDASDVRVRVAVRGCQVEPFVGKCAQGGEITHWPPECRYFPDCVTGSPPWRRLGRVVYATDWTQDFALIEIPERHLDEVRTEVPEWGGPNGTASGGPGRTILYYGHGSLTAPSNARPGVLLRSPPGSGGWAAVGPGLGGDSGSPVVLAKDDKPPYEGGPAFGWVTGGLPLIISDGGRVPHAKVTVLCWAGIEIRVVPGGSFLDGCPWADVGTGGQHGTVVAEDAVNDTWTDHPGADVERVWIDSDGSHVTLSWRVRDLREDQLRTEWRVTLRDGDGRRLTRWVCDAGAHAETRPEEPDCHGAHGGHWDPAQDRVWVHVPYGELGVASGDEVGRINGEARICASRPEPAPLGLDRDVCQATDWFAGTGLHSLE